MNINGTWGTLCGATAGGNGSSSGQAGGGWGDSAAQSVCRHLGFAHGYALEAAFDGASSLPDATSSSAMMPIWSPEAALRSVSNGTAATAADTAVGHTCRSHSSDAGVMCRHSPRGTLPSTARINGSATSAHQGAWVASSSIPVGDQHG